MIHPLLVTRQLADMNMDMVCLETGLLHDVVEDTGAKFEDVRKNFGEEVARCVDGVTKLSKLKLASREERQAESVRKMLLAMVDDIRVILVKLADRLHNMRTLEPSCRGRSRSASPRKPSTSMRPSRTGWGWARSAANWRIWRSGIWSRKPPRDCSRSFEAAHEANEAFLQRDQAYGGGAPGARRNSGSRGRPPEARLLRVPETEAAEDHPGPGVRSAGGPDHHGFGQELLRRPGRHSQ